MRLMHQSAMKLDHRRLEVVFTVTGAASRQYSLNHVTTHVNHVEQRSVPEQPGPQVWGHLNRKDETAPQGQNQIIRVVYHPSAPRGS